MHATYNMMTVYVTTPRVMYFSAFIVLVRKYTSTVNLSLLPYLFQQMVPNFIACCIPISPFKRDYLHVRKWAVSGTMLLCYTLTCIHFLSPLQENVYICCMKTTKSQLLMCNNFRCTIMFYMCILYLLCAVFDINCSLYSLILCIIH